MCVLRGRGAGACLQRKPLVRSAPADSPPGVRIGARAVRTSPIAGRTPRRAEPAVCIGSLAEVGRGRPRRAARRACALRPRCPIAMAWRHGNPPAVKAILASAVVREQIQRKGASSPSRGRGRPGCVGGWRARSSSSDGPAAPTRVIRMETLAGLWSSTIEAMLRRRSSRNRGSSPDGSRATGAGLEERVGSAGRSADRGRRRLVRRGGRIIGPRAGWRSRIGCLSGMTPDEQRVGFGVRWAREHYKEMIVLRLLVAVWIVFVTVFACVKGYWWGLAFLLFLALDLWLLRNLVHSHRAQGR